MLLIQRNAPAIVAALRWILRSKAQNGTKLVLHMEKHQIEISSIRAISRWFVCRDNRLTGVLLFRDVKSTSEELLRIISGIAVTRHARKPRLLRLPG